MYSAPLPILPCSSKISLTTFDIEENPSDHTIPPPVTTSKHIDFAANQVRSVSRTRFGRIALRLARAPRQLCIPLVADAAIRVLRRSR